MTRNLRIHGYEAEATGPLAVYGSDAAQVQRIAANDPRLAAQLHPALPYTGAEVVWAARAEMAHTVEDVLARRTRALFLNSRAALEMAPRVAELLARELGRDAVWAADQVLVFAQLAAGYRVGGGIG